MERYSNYGRILATAAPAPNCTVTVYESGTLTLASIFADNNVSPTPKSNPFTADADSYFFFYAADGLYDVRLSGGGIPVPYTWGAIQLITPFTVPEYTVATLPVSADEGDLALVTDSTEGLWIYDGSSWNPTLSYGVPGVAYASLPSPGVVGQLRRVTDTSRGLWLRGTSQFYSVTGEQLNVKDFGAKGDNSTNDYAAIQAAIDAVGTTGGVVFFPPGIYKIGTPLVTTTQQTTFRGSGLVTSKIVPTYTTSGAITLTIGESKDRCMVEGLGIAVNANSQIGLEIKGAQECATRNVAFTNVGGGTSGIGLRVRSSGGIGAYSGHVDHCLFENLAQGLYHGVDTDANPGANVWTYTACKWTSNNVGVYMTTGNQVLFNGCRFEANSTYGFRIPSTTTAQISDVLWNNCYFENNTTAHIDGGNTGTGRLNASVILCSIFIGGSIVNYFESGANNIRIGSFPGSNGNAITWGPSGTSILLADGTLRLNGSDVTYGIADSGGAGYKLLRVPN